MEEKKITLQEIYPKLVEAVKVFQESLKHYSDEQFQYKNDEETWSLGQMYEHICNASNYFFLANIVRCLEKRKGQMGGEKNQFGDNLYFYGGFPPRKFQVPEVIRPPEIVAKKREEYVPILSKILDDAQKLILPVSLDNGEYKCIQPAFGWLNAYEWFYLLEMHTRHHLRQKKELEKFANVPLF